MSDSLERLGAALADRYTLIREVGVGGMATVYLATDLRHQRKVALKVLRPDLAATLGAERFLQEVRVTANLQHPHILPLFDSGETGGFLYYVMPYVEGESLRQRLTRERELPVSDAARLLRDVVDALAAAHAKGVVHRDVKPENVMLSGHHAMVTDFGVAKAVSEATGRQRLTTMGVALGTPAYMAPEQAAADASVDHRADIYAVGVLAYELLTGRPPFTGATPQQVLTAQVLESPKAVTELRPAVPPAMESLVMRCLEKKPADRWQTAAEMLPHLEAVMTPSGGMTPTDLQPLARAVTKNAGPKPWMAAAGFMGLAAAVAVWWGARGADTGSAPFETATAAEDEEPDRLVVMPLENLTGDSTVDVWAQLAAEWMGRAIDQPRPIAVIPAASVRDALRVLGDTATVAAVAGRLRANQALTGTVARTGGSVRFEVEFLDVRTGERLRALDPVTGPVDSVEAVVGELAQAAAAAAVTLLDPSAPPWMAAFSVPPSVEVYREYLDQWRVFCRGAYADAIAMGNRILSMTPDYAPVLVTNAYAHGNMGIGRAVDSILQVAEPLRPSMTSMERLHFDFLAASRSGDPIAREHAAQEGFRIDPANWAHNAGHQALRMNHLERAVTRYLAADVDAPCMVDWRPWWTQLALAYHLLGRFQDELELARRGLERFPDYFGLLDAEARALAGLGRVEAVDSLVEVMTDLPPAAGFDPGLRPLWAAVALRTHGHGEAARRAMARSLAWYEAQAGGPTYNHGRALYLAGRLADAEEVFSALVAARPDNVNHVGNHGVILALLGRSSEALEAARHLAAWEGSESPGLPLAWRGWIAAALGEKAEAVRLLQEAFSRGFPYGLALHQWDPAVEGMRGYPPWEALVAPRP